MHSNEIMEVYDGDGAVTDNSTPPSVTRMNVACRCRQAKTRTSSKKNRQSKQRSGKKENRKKGKKEKKEKTEKRKKSSLRCSLFGCVYFAVNKSSKHVYRRSVYVYYFQ